jgi:hypothetical protein
MTAGGTFQGVPTSVTFANNVVRPGTPIIPTEQLGISIMFGAVARVSGNTITGAACTLADCGADPILEIQPQASLPHQ